MSDEVDDFLAHYGIKGMRWGVRKPRSVSGYRKYQEQVFAATPGAPKTMVISKTGDKISVEK